MQLRPRRVPQAFNLRVSNGLPSGGLARIEAIGEIFNLFNAENPAAFTTTPVPRHDGGAEPGLPASAGYAGDFQKPEQRVGQIGFRFTF